MFSYKFKIGDYHEEVLWDVMLMNVCHMLLGRPWQFDRKAMHDGYANVVEGYEVLHKLKSLNKIDGKVCKNIGKCLINGVKELVIENNDEDYDLLMQVVAMLIAFQKGRQTVPLSH